MHEATDGPNNIYLGFTQHAKYIKGRVLNEAKALSEIRLLGPKELALILYAFKAIQRLLTLMYANVRHKDAYMSCQRLKIVQ